LKHNIFDMRARTEILAKDGMSADTFRFHKYSISYSDVKRERPLKGFIISWMCFIGLVEPKHNIIILAPCT
jgi:hypothetical protein